MDKTVVINVVGLSGRLIGEHTPFLQQLAQENGQRAIKPVLPAVTCSAQSTYLTGQWPSDHGVVGNGWYFKEECEVKFWRQSNRLVRSPKIWELLKKEDPNFSCANYFWWYNMYSSVDYSITPRPNYMADGRKIPDVYSHPADLRDYLQQELGTFPLFHFWGPKTSIKSSQWIADASILSDKKYDPTLSLIYLPHLDYNIQRHGLDFGMIQKDLKEVDRLVEQLHSHYSPKAHVVVLSEYGITNVNHVVHPNRILREMDLLGIRVERGLELLDAGASKAFAVSDHQIAHIYLNDQSCREKVIQKFEKVKGVEQILVGEGIKANHLAHERTGDIVLVADKNSWFSYYFWMDDKVAPDFARMVDIHKKPGYDPIEMFTDPKDPFVMPKVAWKLFKKKLGFRTLMDVIPLDASLVKGSHGRIPEDSKDWPVLVSTLKSMPQGKEISATDVYTVLENHLKPN